MIIDYNKLYINIQGWMIHELDLRWNELLLFAVIYGFSQDWENKFTGGIEYLEKLLNLPKSTILELLSKLIKKNYIKDGEENYWVNENIL